MKKISNPQKQLNYLFESDCTANDTEFSIDCTKSAKNPTFFYRHRDGIRTDIFNVWKRQDEPEDYSRADIARSYRLGGGF